MRKKSIGVLALFIVAGNLALYAVIFSATTSMVVSGIKAAREECGARYSIESLPLVYGNLFCKE